MTLAFWYTIITTIYQYLVASRIGPALPKSVTNFLTHPGSVAAFPPLSSSLIAKLVLVYLTFLLIILPYAVGGLYGGIASALETQPKFSGFFSFFRFGYINFWRSLTQIVLAFLYILIVIGIAVGIIMGVSLALGSVSGAVAIIIMIAAVFWLASTLLYWFGFTFSTQEMPIHGLLLAMRWSSTHVGLLLARIFVLLVLLFATMLVVTLIALGIPIIGEIIEVLVVGMVLPAFLATYAVLFFQESALR